jgi:tetratricopeptide (TPR) repeat protein
MMRRAAAVLLALGLALPPALAAAVDPGVAQLLERAQFWQGRARDDLAREELEKIFRLAPDQPEALVMQARIELRLNQDREATATFERLRKAHPTHPGVAQIAALLRVRGPDRDKFRQARQLARVPGRGDEAVAAYRALFPDGMPDDEIALEFAQALAGTANGWEPARAQLSELARRHPDDPRYQVALASHVSTRKPVSAETLKTLRELSGVAAVARQAREAWRRAVLAMDVAPESVPALREYIAANPGETAVQERLDKMVQDLAQGGARPRDDPATRARRQGWAALDAGRNEEAEARFTEAIRSQPKDGDAIGGLGLLRMRQGRHAEALGHFERAKALDAANRSKWESLAQTARYWDLLAQSRHAREAGKLDVAEARVRAARAIDPKEPNGAAELARVLLAAGRDREAEAMLSELPPAERRAIGDAIDSTRAARLRDEAKSLQARKRDKDAVVALEKAAALEPNDPWVRLDLARLYATRGESERGKAVFEELLGRRPNDADTRYAFAIYLSGVERDAEAMRMLEAIAPGERSANMTRMQRRLWLSIQGTRAAALAERGEREEAARVVALARETFGSAATPEEAEAIAAFERSVAMREARALRDAGRSAEAAEAYRRILAKSPGDREAELALIDTLIDRGEADAARPVLESVLRASPEEPRALSAAAQLALRAGHLDQAIAYEQRAMGAGSRGEAWRYRRLAEWLDQEPNWYSSALDWLQRSGTRGKSQVSAQELPLAWREGWAYGGRWFARVAPARVASGGIDLEDVTEANTFGSALLCLPQCPYGAPDAVEKGVALNAGFERAGWRFDIGSTPIGFPVVNVVGGIANKGDWGPFSYTLEAARRPLPSSLLSYAGTRDPNTGKTWGGVVANGLRLNLSRDSGGEYGAWSVLGAYRYTGRNVQDNDKLEIMAGFYRRFVNEDDRLATVGLTGMAWHFSENAGEFTFGHGGYYSPKTYRSLALPVTYGWRTQRTSVLLRASVSVAWSESRRAPFYPTEPELQARAEALQPTTFVEPFYSGGSDGRSYGRAVAAIGEHQLAPNVFIGARLELERSTNYTPNRFLLYVRFTADKAAARPVALPPEPTLPGFQY